MPKSRNRAKKRNLSGNMSHQNKPSRVLPQQTSVQVQQTHTSIKGELFKSNYPPPEMMEKYAQIDSEFPNRLLQMAEKEGEHRRKMDEKLTSWAIFLDILGAIFALLAVGGILFVGYLFMKNDHPRSGAAVICSVAVTIAIAFLRGRRNGRNT